MLNISAIVLGVWLISIAIKIMFCASIMLARPYLVPL